MSMDHEMAIKIIAGTLEKLSEPLTEMQKIAMTGSMAVIIEKVRFDAIRDLIHAGTKLNAEKES